MAGGIYNHTEIEEKWQQVWASLRLFQDTQQLKAQQKEFLLFAFAYPSGSGLHVGHVESKTALDIKARFSRMNGKNVYFPVGWDAFGLPAENYAIKTGIHPVETTKAAINTFRQQIQRLGISYDWANETATNHPDYYRWTQWLFLQLYKKGLAYQGLGMVNWCPSCQTVLANEQVVNGKCERCDSLVEQRDLKQWYFKITEYKDELLTGLDDVDWPEPTRQQQRNWIGKAKGLAIDFSLEETGQKMTVWTKFWETVFGVTFVVIAPEAFNKMNLLEKVSVDRRAEVEKYLETAKHKTEEERRIGEKDKTGVLTGLTVINPVNGSKVPLFIADYVLMGVGTAVVMGVPAHDERDFAFAKKYNLPIKQVVTYTDQALDQAVRNGDQAVEAPGLLVNSGVFDGQEAWGDGKQAMADWMIKEGFADWQTTYKLRDWLISRQRYWGAPIPVVYDPEGQPHPVKEEHLPWVLPVDVDFKPTGESPLKSSKEFIERTERLYGVGWRPEFDTMDTFVDSSWYFLRYCDSRNKEKFADEQKLAHWLPVDLYLIGPEHIVLHLLYSRFFTKFLRDEGYLKVDEPFAKMRHQGMILGPDGKKMSKSKGNVINPDEIVEEFGADTLRVYEMFMGPLETDKPWDPRAVAGVYRFLRRVHGLVLDNKQQLQHHLDLKSSLPLQRKLHQTIRKATFNIPQLKFNTVISTMMELTNLWEEEKKTAGFLSNEDLLSFILLLAPFAPFLTEELYSLCFSGQEKNDEYRGVHVQSWPIFDPVLAQEENVNFAVQVNGKIRAQMQVEAGQAGEKDFVLKKAKELAEVKLWLEGKAIVKEIFVPGKIVSFVVR
ncbi:MAG: leucine--tRNA ligase [Candidatus Pacebacteria bacterium CG10_big_fil_rev_8_21_14_0_10_36_11]|nr:leucine--tRNA ligase [Candidatus Pacearchaeota archaeon]OIP73956.1 MAG: leucine--tRNA ligase [Candidatus Pacebacteria bacterium CG2_30_36_39]PIR64404.1 MAG: leucine--tRNA ligase [Candidatus Pacebacteria bacterium CG10_big_fil_rev_8_21_14_0_10_36_11]